jgi:hypothetical protein
MNSFRRAFTGFIGRGSTPIQSMLAGTDYDQFEKQWLRQKTVSEATVEDLIGPTAHAKAVPDASATASQTVLNHGWKRNEVEGWKRNEVGGQHDNGNDSESENGNKEPLDAADDGSWG